MQTLVIRQSRQSDLREMLAIVNDAAQAYRGVIPEDRWREPYMPRTEMDAEIAQGVEFWVAEDDGRLLGLMGTQDKGRVALIRHAYVAPGAQGKGIGARLLHYVTGLTDKPFLVGTWADAFWAIGFYRRNGFTLVPRPRSESLLREYWSIPARQVETSVVLADEKWADAERAAESDV